MSRRPLIDEYQRSWGLSRSVLDIDERLEDIQRAGREGDVSINQYVFSGGASAGGGGGGVTDHGALTGLADNDHPQYARKAILYDAIVDSADPEVGSNDIYAELLDAITDGHESIFFRQSTDSADITIAAQDVTRIVGDTSLTATVPVNITCTKIGVLFDSLRFDGDRLNLSGAQCRAFACLFVGTLTLGTALINLPTSSTKTVTNATNASPIQITATAHGFSSGDPVLISAVGGNTAANGMWQITVVDANNFTLDGSAGNAAYTAGGQADKQGYNRTAASIAFDGGANGGLPTAGYGRVDQERIAWSSGGAASSGTLTLAVGGGRGYEWTLRRAHADNATITNMHDAHLIINAEECDVTACYFVGCNNADAQGVLITQAGSKATLQVCRFIANTLYNNVALVPGLNAIANAPLGVQIIGCKFIGSVKDFHVSVWNANNSLNAGSINALQVNGSSFVNFNLGAVKLFGSANVSGNSFSTNHSTTFNNRAYQVNKSGGISATTYTIPYDTASGNGTIPDKGLIEIDSEWIAYGAFSGTEFQHCIRGFNGTTPATHTDNAVITAIAELCTATTPGDSTAGNKAVLISGNSYQLAASLTWAQDYQADETSNTPMKTEFTGNSIGQWKRAIIGGNWSWNANLVASGTTPYVDCRSQVGIKFSGGAGVAWTIRNIGTDTQLDLMHSVVGTGVLSRIQQPDNIFTAYGGVAGHRSGATVPLTNRSASASVTGHVAIIDTGNDFSWTRTNTGGLADVVLGVVVSNGIANLSDTLIGISGVFDVLCNGTVNRGEHLETSTTTGEARARPGYVANTTFARALTARSGAGSSVVKALVYGPGG